MRTALDTNILSSLWSQEPSARGIARTLESARAEGALVLSPVVLAELFGHPRMTELEILSELEELGIEVDFDLSRTAWIETARRYGRYCERRRDASGQSPKRLAADFIVGAHALFQADRLMTMDLRRYAVDFPELFLLRVEE